MNLGDGLLFELENGKPKLILLSRGVEKNPAKLSFGPRKANVLSSRRPLCEGEARGDEERPGRQQQAGRHRETKSKAGGAAAPFTSTTGGGRSTAVTSSKTQQRHRGHNVHAVAEAKSDRHKDDTAVGSLRADGKKGRLRRGGTSAAGSEGVTGSLASGGTGPKDTEGCLTDGQLQKILLSVQTSSVGPHPPEEHRTRGTGCANQSDPKEGGSLIIDGGEMKEEDRGGGTETSGRSLDKDDRSSACAFSWQEERHSDSRAAADAKKALWRRELDEQVALKQQRSAPGRLQAEFSVQSSISHRDQPAAIRSSLRLGEVTPMEEEQSAERRREQRRRWLEELDQQREETSQRRRQEKLLQRQTEDHELWARHFDSLKRRPPAPSSPPPSTVSERGEWEPSSSLSLVWEATSSCGAESVGRASVDTSSAHPTRARYLRSMTALLDPAQIEERDRRRLKQLEQQRAIEAQVEERRVQREREEARRREELEEEERRVALEREALERQFALDTLRQKSSAPAQQPDTEDEDNERPPKTLETSVSRQSDSLEDNDSSSSPCRDTAVQTVPSLPLRVQTPEVSAHYQTPPPPPSAAPPNVRNRVVRTGKENICLPAARGGGGRGRGGGGGGGGRGRGGDGDPYEVFARTDGNERRPEWNTQRPGPRFVPASERYPPPLQRNRQESRQRRQAELLALQDRTCLSRTDPPNPPPPSPHQEPRLCSNPPQTRTGPPVRVQNVSRGQSVLAAINAERGRSPPRAGDGDQRQRAPSSSPPPPLEFVPYMRSDEVFHMDPLEPADTPPPPTRSEAPLSSVSPPVPSHRRLHTEPPRKTHTHRQQEILRGLAQLRQGLLQKQRELETELNPLSKRHGNEHRK
nr:coiled-coil domain-containing protein 66 isoform X1 [Gasterosteus aculeatus aculeatus]